MILVASEIVDKKRCSGKGVVLRIILKKLVDHVE